MVCRAFSLMLLVVALSGCMTSPATREGEKNVEHIHFVENRSVDQSVRRDFDAALQLLHDERYKEGVELLKKVIERSQNNSAPYINMAIAYEKMGEMQSAEESLKRALEINPEHPVTNNEYALLYRRTGRYAEARQLYEKVLARYPEFMPARKNLGILCEVYLDDTECALKQYEIYSKANPEDEEVALWIVSLKKRLGR